MEILSFREIAKKVADLTHTILMASSDEALDGDQTEEISVMIREELDVLNGNICPNCYQPEDEDGRCGCTNDDGK